MKARWIRLNGNFETIYLFELSDESKAIEHDLVRSVGGFKTIYLNDESEATEYCLMRFVGGFKAAWSGLKAIYLFELTDESQMKEHGLRRLVLSRPFTCFN